ncbi:unnamed protein product [Closterium sp. NIES-53]
MPSLRFLAFDPEGRPVAFDTWHDDLQLYLLSDLKDSVSLFDHVSGAAPAPPATDDVSPRSQWLSRDSTARLAIRNYLPATKCAHFGEHRTAQTLYDAVVARYSSPATAASGRLLLPYLFPSFAAITRPPIGPGMTPFSAVESLVHPVIVGRGGEFSSNLLRDFCRGEGITQSFTLPDSPQQNGIAERRIGLVMEVARTSMIHAAAPHFLWPFAVRYATHQLNLWPRVSFTESSPTQRWTGKVGNASVFRVWVLPPHLAPRPPVSGCHVRDTCTDLCELRSYLGLQITRDRARCTITPTQSHMVHQVLQCFGFQYSSPQLTPLSTSHSLSAPPSDESVEPSGPYPELVGCLMYLMTCTRPDLAYPLSLLARYVALGRPRKVHWDAAKRVLHYLCSTSGMGLVLGGQGPVVLTGHADASWVDDSATQRSSQGYTFSLGSGSVSWQSTRLSLVLSSSCEAEIYAGAMAAQELRWLTYLLTDFREQPRSPPVLYVDNKAMIALCQEHRLEHRTKHIALGYFLARELQQRGQLRLAYVASRANTSDVFTKALPPGDHQRFVTVLGLLTLLCFFS